MINLIPPQAKKFIVREYWFRVVTVWLFLLSGVILVAFFIMIPSYVLVQSQLDAVETEVLKVGETEIDFKKSEDFISEINAVAVQLGEAGVLVPLYEIASTIQNAASVDIKLTNQTIKRNKVGIESINIRGVAKSRSALAGFKTALERSALFETALIPISDLAREEDLPFAITVTMSSIRDRDIYDSN